jgi:hypothetical protein
MSPTVNQPKGKSVPQQQIQSGLSGSGEKYNGMATKNKITNIKAAEVSRRKEETHSYSHIKQNTDVRSPQNSGINKIDSKSSFKEKGKCLSLLKMKIQNDSSSNGSEVTHERTKGNALGNKVPKFKSTSKEIKCKEDMHEKQKRAHNKIQENLLVTTPTSKVKQSSNIYVHPSKNKVVLISPQDKDPEVVRNKANIKSPQKKNKQVLGKISQSLSQEAMAEQLREKYGTARVVSQDGNKKPPAKTINGKLKQESHKPKLARTDVKVKLKICSKIGKKPIPSKDVNEFKQSIAKFLDKEYEKEKSMEGKTSRRTQKPTKK